ncbi:tetratricopeptide repeat protein [Oceanimonas pelagia]|uniref:Tetratricopeptide repeat protein n=1 Tax=Oceanimonas pelagia TaxID=3028314 RepID=A0AA50Q970_9GAMM|nr:tetratricopeptide repeat protein [Oceanimonas pelagia]WMC09698.1 tetratricopeptide repeat protein [Oceanimonas pelagia]
MLESNISARWLGDEPLDLMTLALDVVESLAGLDARDEAERELFALERALSEELEGMVAPLHLLPCLYDGLGLSGDSETFFSIDNCLMNRVLARREGIPVSLGILLIHLCRRFGVEAEGICFPGHFLVRVFSEEEGAIIDPFTGRQLSRREIEQLLRGAQGNLARLTPGHLKSAEDSEILARLLNVTKAAFIHDQQFGKALACSELLLRLKPDCPFERRDRGFLYQQLDCGQLAADDFEFFIEHCPDDPIADVLKAQMAGLDLTPKTLH